MYFVPGDESAPVVARPRYRAAGTEHWLELMKEAGFVDTERLDGRYFQPVLRGRRPPNH